MQKIQSSNPPFFVPLFFLLLFMSFESEAADFSTQGRGILYTIESLDTLTDEVTRQSDGSYLISSSLIIANQSRPDILQLTPGAILRFVEGSTLQIEGTLIAIGTEASPITLTSNTADGWGGVVFDQATEASVIKYARIKNANIGITCKSTSPQIEANRITHCKTYAIATTSADPIIRKNRISNHRGAIAVYVQSASPQITDNDLELTDAQTGIILIDSDAHLAQNRFHGGNVAIACRAGSPRIEGNKISGATTGVSGLRSDFIISDNQIDETSTGIYVDSGKPTIQSNHIRNSSLAAISIWNSPSGELTENTIDSSQVGIYSKNAKLTIDQNHFHENGYAVYIKSGDAQIHRNTFKKNTDAGIAFWDGATGEIIDNEFSDNRYGIYTQTASPTIQRNRIDGGEYGIHIQTASPAISDNRITNASEGGIGCWGGSPEIFANTITRSRYGIYADGSAPVISQNTITDSHDAGIATWNNSRPDIQDNMISGGRYEVFRDDLPSQARSEPKATAGQEAESRGEWEDERVRKGGPTDQPIGQPSSLFGGEERATLRTGQRANPQQKIEADGNQTQALSPSMSGNAESQSSSVATSFRTNPTDANPQSEESSIGQPSSLFNTEEQERLRAGQRAEPGTEPTRQATYQLVPMQPENAFDNQQSTQPPSQERELLPAPNLPPQQKDTRKLTGEQTNRLMSLEEMLEDDSIDLNEKIAKQFEIGQLHFKGGNYHEALEAYNWIVVHVIEQMEKQPSAERSVVELANIHYHRALSYYELKDYANAIDTARICLTLEPESEVKHRVQYLLAMSTLENQANVPTQSVNVPTQSMGTRAEKAFLEFIRDAENKDGISPLVANAHFQIGRLALERGAYRKAIEGYRHAISHGISGVQRAEALSELGYATFQLDDHAEAQRWYHKLVEDEGAHSGLLAPAFLALGNLHRAKEAWAEAESFYSSALQHAEAVDLDKPVRGEIAFRLGESLYSQSRFFGAISAFENAVSLDREAMWFADAVYGLAQSQNEMEDFQAALESYRRAASVYAQRVRTTLDSENLERSQERLARSKFQIADITAKNASSEQNHENLIGLYREAYQASKAVQDETLRNALLKDALIGQAKAASQLGQETTVSQSAESLAEVSQGDSVGLTQAADLFFDMKKYRSASDLYRQAMSLENADNQLLAHGWMRLGFSHFQLAQQDTKQVENLRQAVEAYDEAIVHLKSVINNQQLLIDAPENLRQPQSAIETSFNLQTSILNRNNARYHAAVAHKLLGEDEKAVERFEQVIEADKTGEFRAQSFLMLAGLYEKLEQYDDAIRTYEQASLELKAASDLALALERMGEISYQQGKYSVAIDYYQELLNRYPESKYAAAAQYFVGLCYSSKAQSTRHSHAERGNEIELALAAYEKTVRNYPDTELAIDAYWNAAALNERVGRKAEALRYAKQIVDSYGQSSETHAQGIVYSARNLISNLLLTDPTLEPNGTSLLTQQLEAITQLPNATPQAQANAYFELGNLHANAKDTNAALLSYQSAKQISDSDELQTKIGYRETSIYFAQGEYVKVVKTGLKTLKRMGELESEKIRSFAGHLQYLMGQSQMQLDRVNEAEEAFQQAIALKKEDAEINAHSHFYLGQIYERREQTDEAITAYQNVLSVANHTELKEIRTEATRQLAHIYENSAGESLQNQAIDLYAQISAADVSPKLTAEALYRRGLIYQSRNEPAKAAAELSQLVDRFSKETEPEIKEMVEDAILRLPNLSSQTGDMNTAIKTAKRALGIAQKKGDVLLLAQAQFQLATLYYQNGTDGKEAVKLFKVAYDNALKTVNSDSTTVALANTAMFQAGQAAYQNSDQAAAIQPLENFIRQFPDDEKIDVVYEYLAWSYFTIADKTKARAGRKARFKKAAAAFNQLVTRNVNPEKSPEWLYQSAQALTLAGETAQAIVAYQELMQVHPKHNLADEAFYTVGGMQFESKQYDEALKTYQQLENGYPDSEWIDDALYAIATCYDQLKQDEKALETYKAVIERFPDQTIAVNAQANIGHHYFNVKEYTQALEAYRKLTKKSFPAMTAKHRSNAYRWRRDAENVMAEAPYKEAVSLLNKADTGSENPSDEEKGYAQRAIQQFEGLIADYPYCAYVDYALASIGSAHELREEWNSAMKAYRRLTARYKRKPPTDANIQQMLDYAQERIKAIEVFLLQKEKFGL